MPLLIDGGPENLYRPTDCYGCLFWSKVFDKKIENFVNRYPAYFLLKIEFRSQLKFLWMYEFESALNF
jgi:hypothetical protein